MKRLKDDSGVAMITAILVTMLVVSLSMVSFRLATHDLDQSGNDRRRVQAIHAAEAGLDRYLHYLAAEAIITNPLTALPTQVLSTSPPASFTAAATYYCAPDGSGPVWGSGGCVAPNTPASALIRSVGTAAGRSRTMTAFVGLESVPGGYTLSGSAVYAGGVATWTGQATITSSAGSELGASLYSAGDLELKGGGTVHGNVEAQGKLTLSGSTDVKRDATSKGQLSVSNNTIVRGDARSTAAGITSGGRIVGNAYYCTGSAPGGTVGGSRIQACPQPPGPSLQNFKDFTFIASDWQAEGYLVNTYSSCSTAQGFLNNIPAGKYVVRITASCDLTIPNLVIKGDLAIITNGTISTTGATSLSVGGPGPLPYTLSLMATILNQEGSCPSNATGITVGAGTNFPAGVDVLFYSPCDVRFTGNANASIQGQIIAGRNVTFASGSNITYKPIFVPGISDTGFAESLHYRREVPN